MLRMSEVNDLDSGVRRNDGLNNAAIDNLLNNCCYCAVIALLLVRWQVQPRRNPRQLRRHRRITLKHQRIMPRHNVL